MEEVKIKVRPIVTLVNKQDWIDRIPQALPKKNFRDEFIFIDNEGYTLTCREDFSAAEKLTHFPVKVFLLIRTSNALYYSYSPRFNTAKV